MPWLDPMSSAESRVDDLVQLYQDCFDYWLTRRQMLEAYSVSSESLIVEIASADGQIREISKVARRNLASLPFWFYPTNSNGLSSYGLKRPLGGTPKLTGGH